MHEHSSVLDRITDEPFRRAVHLIDEGQIELLEEHLARSPDLTRRRVPLADDGYFREPTLLAFVAENPVRRGVLPSNIVAIARTILECGGGADRDSVTETLSLVVSGRVAREAGVQGSLIQLLCAYGADPDEALPGALVHGEFAAARALVDAGAQATLEFAAALGDVDMARMLVESGSADGRQCAFALACQFGHANVARLLLGYDVTVNGFSPPSSHPHSTPLHQAALGGHEEVVRLLREHGAAREVRDKVWNGTPAAWAEYGGHAAVAKLLGGDAA